MFNDLLTHKIYSRCIISTVNVISKELIPHSASKTGIFVTHQLKLSKASIY